MATAAKLHSVQPLGRLLSLLGKGYLNLLRDKLKHLDINRNYYALLLIERQDGTITQQELAKLLDSDKVSIVRVVDYLSVKGYVKRIGQANDRRKHCLELTEKARLALPEIREAIDDLNAMVLNGLKSSEISDFSTVLVKIRFNITENIHNL